MEPSFLQSADWAQFQAAMGHAVIESDGIRFFKNSLPFGVNYLYCPHPDVVDSATFLELVTGLAREHSAWFVRVEPNAGSSSLESGGSGKSSIRPTLAVQPSRTWHVPLGPDEQMLAAMHEKTRYNIRVAEKKGVTVRFSSEPADVNVLVGLLEKTGGRAGIRLHDANYYRTMMEVLASGVMLDRKTDDLSVAQDQASSSSRHGSLMSDVARGDSGSRMTRQGEGLTAELAIAEFEAQPVAVALIAHFGDRVIYLHGGSDYEQRSLMGPHLLHWTVMQRAHAAGQKIYDMGGIAPDELANSKQQTASGSDAPADSRLPIADSSPAHPWAGISRFKRGFGGTPIDYPPAVDVVVSPMMYGIYKLARSFRRSLG